MDFVTEAETERTSIFAFTAWALAVLPSFIRTTQHLMIGRPAKAVSGQIGSRRPTIPSRCRATCTRATTANGYKSHSYAPPSVQTVDEPHNVAGGNLLARWHRQINESSDFQLQSYYDRTSQLSPQLDEIRNTLDVDFLYHLNLNERHDLSLGAGARWSPDNITQKFDTLNFVPQQETDSIYSWFLQDQISLMPGQLSADLRFKVRTQQLLGVRDTAKRTFDLDADRAPVRMGGDHARGPHAFASRSGSAAH